MKKNKYTRVLTIAGSDCSGGAGIQADIKTFAAHRCYGMSVITALTAQNTIGVTSIQPLSPSFVLEQLKSTLDDIGVDAIKIGMLHDADIIEMLSPTLKRVQCPIVLDPVMIAKGGQTLLHDHAMEALQKKLFPIATLLTPNLPEAELLTGMDIKSRQSMKKAAIQFELMGVRCVLIKGGHAKENNCYDLLYQACQKQFYGFESERINTTNTHGTGCTLSAAIACGLAKRIPITQAVRDAKNYLYGAINQGQHYQCGQGHGPVNHHYIGDTHVDYQGSTTRSTTYFAENI